MGVNDYGGPADTTASVPFGGIDGWAESVAQALNNSDETVDARLEAYAAARATVGNLLTDNQASGGDTLGTTSGFTSANSTLQYSTSENFSGAGSIRVVATSTATATVSLDEVPVVSGQAYTFTYAGKRGTVSTSIDLVFQWIDSGGSVGSNNYVGAIASGNAWEQKQNTFVAPANAVAARVYLYSRSTAIGEDSYFDHVGLWQGAGGNWSMPGTPIIGLGTRITRPNVDDRLVEQWNGSAWSVVDYDSGVRNIASVLLNGWTATSLRVRRVNDTCRVQLIGLNGASATSNVAFNFTGSMAQFRPDNAGANRVLGMVGPATNGLTNAQFATLTTVQFVLNRITSSGANAATGEVVWSTDQAIPNTLPGTLVSPAPQ